MPIAPDQKPWTTGVQFHNGGCEKYSIARIYAKIWYDTYIGSGVLKTQWNLTAPIPSFEEWFNKDAKGQGNPKTEFGSELKRKVREARGKNESLRENRAAVNELFNPLQSDIDNFKKEIQSVIAPILEMKDYWLTIQGDLDGEFYCKWYTKFILGNINTINIRKEHDIWFDILCDDGIQLSSILRWGKGAGFSNIRIDAR
jgi:hypothetical protein